MNNTEKLFEISSKLCLYLQSSKHLTKPGFVPFPSLPLVQLNVLLLSYRYLSDLKAAHQAMFNNSSLKPTRVFVSSISNQLALHGFPLQAATQLGFLSLQSLSDAPRHSWLGQGKRGKKDFLLFQPCFSQLFSAVKLPQLQVLCLEQSVKHSSSQPQGVSTPSPGATSLESKKRIFLISL